MISKAARLDPDIADVTTIRNIPLNHRVYDTICMSSGYILLRLLLHPHPALKTHEGHCVKPIWSIVFPPWIM
jgi:hypothetical protein